MIQQIDDPNFFMIRIEDEKLKDIFRDEMQKKGLQTPEELITEVLKNYLLAKNKNEREV